MASVPIQRPASLALTASAAKITKENSAYLKRLAMPWQDRALLAHDEIGELHYASKFYERLMKPLRIYPALIGEDQKVTPIEDGRPVELLDRIQDPGGGRTSILGAYGRLMFITGEGFLFGRHLDTDDERWSFVWRDELKFDDRGNVVAVATPQASYAGEATFEGVEQGSTVAYRMWTPHPRFSSWPDSPMRAVLDVAEELRILSDSVRGTAVSRIVKAGMLLMPQEISPGAIAPVGDEDPKNDPFADDFGEHIEESMETVGTAAGAAPYVLWAAAEMLEKIRWLEMHNTETDYLERDLRTEAIKRMALGLDLPPEVLTGFSDSNHWSAWAIRDDMWRIHGGPIAEQFCDDLADSYLRPALRDEGFGDWQRVVVDYDATAIVVNPDRGKDADEAWDRGAIGYKAYRTAKKFTEDDAQSEEEHGEWLAVKTRGVLGDAERPEAEVEEGPPPGEPGPVSEQTNLPNAEAARILGAAELAVLRCRELAGSRIRANHKVCPDCVAPANGKPNALVASSIGPDGIANLNVGTPGKLVEGGADLFKVFLLDLGFSTAQAEAASELLEHHAARTLFEERPLSVPTGMTTHLRRLREAA